jgi:hypothetical protein
VNPGEGGDWQLVASGIEDLQVEYLNNDGAGAGVGWAPDPGTVTPPDYGTLVREVRVTLRARTTGQQNLQGESVSVGGVTAIRGRLASVTSPRAALFALSIGPPVGNAQRWE